MNHSRQLPWWLVFCVAGQWLVCPMFAGTVPSATAPVELLSVPTARPPGLLHPRSPVALFRQLLAMTPEEREAYLANRPPEIRERILAKVNEYEALDPDERELRLRATELRWYLLPLMRDSPSNRDAGLARVPTDMRELVKARLDQWIILPPQLQQEFLENESALHYFAHLDVSNYSTLSKIAPPGSELARWTAMTETQRKQIAANVNQFFELAPDEKQEALNTLSDAERTQMEKTLQTFDKLPPGQREECIHAFAKFASMNELEKREFLKNAQRWSQMSPADRQTWRDLVANVPQWPPLPQGFIMPPPPLPPDSHSVATTNPD
ncbi:MAG TPA: DUF3106 domain-containing protein [Candidatus Saccharimonadales bacterium]|nr:DUF3106 domain-containing protein [Candidatus Saccharimonadales bacterium]